MDNAVQADLRFFLPIQADQKVLIVGDAPRLAEIVGTIAQVTVVAHWDELAMHAAPAFDHLFIPILTPTLRPNFLREAQRWLRPDGWLCVGVGNAQSVYRLRFWKRSTTRQARFSFAQCQDLAPRIEGIYGVHDGLKNPQYFVPLTAPNITLFFVQHLMTPKSNSAKLVKKLLLFLTKFKLHYTIFSDMVVIVKFS